MERFCRLSGELPAVLDKGPRTWAKRTDYQDWRFEDAFRAFAAQRGELLGTLDALTPGEWERTATVTAYGQANQRTLLSYASKLATHERTHVRDLERSLTAGGSE